MRALHAGYGQSQVLQGVDFELRGGEIVALLGRNGAGRSTLARALMGLVRGSGSIEWNGRELCGARTFEIARAGIGYVPESRDVFPTLTVQQNLRLGEQRTRACARSVRRWTQDDVFTLFPGLRARRQTPAGVLSGGEQQMLALGRMLMGAPELVIVDEPTEGLAPQLVQQVGGLLRELRRQQLAVLLIEQKLTLALEVADRCLVMGHGRIVFAGAPQALRACRQVQREWLEV